MFRKEFFNETKIQVKTFHLLLVIKFSCIIGFEIKKIVKSEANILSLP